MFKWRDQLILTFSLKDTIFLKDVVDYDCHQTNKHNAGIFERTIIYLCRYYQE